MHGFFRASMAKKNQNDTLPGFHDQGPLDFIGFVQEVLFIAADNGDMSHLSAGFGFFLAI